MSPRKGKFGAGSDLLRDVVWPTREGRASLKLLDKEKVEEKVLSNW